MSKPTPKPTKGNIANRVQRIIDDAKSGAALARQWKSRDSKTARAVAGALDNVKAWAIAAKQGMN